MFCNHYPELNNLRGTPSHGQIININETQYLNCFCDVRNAILKVPFAKVKEYVFIIYSFRCRFINDTYGNILWLKEVSSNVR